MAMKTGRRSSSRKLETRAHANRAFKRVTRQWQLSQNIKCQILVNAPGPACPNGGKILIFSLPELLGSSAWLANANFPDAVRIRRIEGNLYFRPTPVAPVGTDPLSCYINAINQSEETHYMRIGLRKAQGGQANSGVPTAMNPLDNGANPQELSDYADGRWMKMWEHVWDPDVHVQGNIAPNFSCCSVQDGYAVPGWTMASGTGTQAGFNVPPIVCEPCGDVEDPAINAGCSLATVQPRWWRCPIRYGRTIVLKENDDLALYLGWETLQNTFDLARRPQAGMEFFGGIRLLLES